MLKRKRTDLPLQCIEVGPASGGAGDGLIVAIHGRGSDSEDLADLVPMLDPSQRFRFIFPNAPRPFETSPGYTYGFSWFTGWPAETKSIQESRKLVAETLTALQNEYGLDDSRTILSGFSQGGLMALDVGFRRPSPLAGIVVMSGALYEVELPNLRSDQPVLIVHGVNDNVIPVLAARRLRSVLAEHGNEAEYHEFRMGHEVSQQSIAAVAEFVHRKLKTATDTAH